MLDGELVIPIGETSRFRGAAGRASIRPRAASASSPRETPALLIVFDPPGDSTATSLTSEPLAARRKLLEAFLASTNPSAIGSRPSTPDPAPRRQRWLDSGGGALDGVIAKRLDDTYRAGERAMLKVKNIRTADCVVGGFRYGTGSTLVASLLLGLYDDAGRARPCRLHLGARATRTSPSSPRGSRPCAAKASPATPPAARAAGRPSAPAPMSPLARTKLVVEVSYDHVTGGRFRHGTGLQPLAPRQGAAPMHLRAAPTRSPPHPKLVRRLLAY